MSSLPAYFGGVVLRVKDTALTQRFYESLGVRFGNPHRHGEGPEHVAHAPPPGAFAPIVEIYPLPKCGTVGPATLIYVPDIEAAVAAIGSKAPIRDNGGSLSASVRDPDGNRVILYQPPA